MTWHQSCLKEKLKRKTTCESYCSHGRTVCRTCPLDRGNSMLCPLVSICNPITRGAKVRECQDNGGEWVYISASSQQSCSSRWPCRWVLLLFPEVEVRTLRARTLKCFPGNWRRKEEHLPQMCPRGDVDLCNYWSLTHVINIVLIQHIMQQNTESELFTWCFYSSKALCDLPCKNTLQIHAIFFWHITHRGRDPWKREKKKWRVNNSVCAATPIITVRW